MRRLRTGRERKPIEIKWAKTSDKRAQNYKLNSNRKIKPQLRTSQYEKPKICFYYNRIISVALIGLLLL